MCKIWQVDAFADEPFAGNPAGVCILDEFPSDQWMQGVASEMNLAETAFAIQLEQPNRFHLRWFTPAVEVDLCGHATLATAHILFEQGIAHGEQPICFHSRSGELVCQKGARMIALDFPATPPKEVRDTPLREQLVDALKVDFTGEILRSRFDVMVVLEDEEQVRQLTPSIEKLSRIDARGVIVTALGSDPGLDFVSRFFAPQSGVDEDPVTGSAHCCLAPYWGATLGKDQVVGFQASRRGGRVECRLIGDRVQLSGNAVTVIEGEWKGAIT